MTAFRQVTATLTVTRGPDAGRRFDIGATTVTIGRYGECDIQVRDTWVSRWHARVSWNGIEYVVEDFGSTNGTYVNGQRVGAPRALRSGDRLQLGEQVELVFQVGVSPAFQKMPVNPDTRPFPGRGVSPSGTHEREPEAKPSQSRRASKKARTRLKTLTSEQWRAVLIVALVLLIIVLFLVVSGEDGGGRIGATPRPKAVITIVSAVQGESRWGRTQVVVRVRNGSGRTAVGVEVHADCYRGGTVVATDWMPVKPREFEPGQESTQDVTFGEGVVCDDIKVWTDVFRWE